MSKAEVNSKIKFRVCQQKDKVPSLPISKDHYSVQCTCPVTHLLNVN